MDKKSRFDIKNINLVFKTMINCICGLCRFYPVLPMSKTVLPSFTQLVLPIG